MIVEVHVGCGLGRGFLAVIEEVDFAVGPAEEHESAATDIACLGMDDRQRECHGDRCVHRIATLLHDFDPGLRRFGADGGDHGLGTMGWVDGVAGQCLDAERKGENGRQQLASQFHRVMAAGCGCRFAQAHSGQSLRQT